MQQKYADLVASRLIEQLAQGTAPWLVPWKPGERFLPYNPKTGKSYRGMNAVWLLSVAESQGYRDARWLTYRQAAELGGQVRRGEKSTIIQYWQWRQKQLLRDPETGEQLLGEAGQPLFLATDLARPRVFSALVFNAGQIDGLPAAEQRAALPEWKRHEIAEAILANAGVPIEHRPGDLAAYSPGRDRITLPERSQFETADRYYAVALHEEGHATGHPSRLSRDLSHPFGSAGYAREELRAEIASMMLGEQIGIGHDPGQHAAYISHWIEILREDPKEIFRAAADAERILTFLKALAPQLQQTEEQQAEAEEHTVAKEPAAEIAQPRSERSFIEVPYAEKDEAKALGARWDRSRRSWFVPETLALEPFARWLPKNAVSQTFTDPCEAFAEVLTAAGFKLKGLPEMDGTLRRVTVDGDSRGKKSGAYVGHLGGIKPAGWYLNYRTGETRAWKSDGPTEELTPAQRAELLRLAEEKRNLQEIAQKAIHQETVGLLRAHLAKASAPGSDHPYLARKGIKPYGALLDTTGPLSIPAGRQEPQLWSAKGNLLIPVTNLDGAELLSAQSIAPDGRKAFPRGGMLAAGVHFLGERSEVLRAGVVVVEGFATGATIHEMTGMPVAVAFSANNLLAVARQLREAHPEAEIYVAGDNDHHKEQETDAQGRPKPNAGRLAAEKTAAAVIGIAVIPDFQPEDRGTDWNDLAVGGGPDLFLRQWRTALSVGEERRKAVPVLIAPHSDAHRSEELSAGKPADQLQAQFLRAEIRAQGRSSSR